MSHPVIYGFARGFTRLEREALNAVRRHHYDHPQPEGAHVNHLADVITAEAHNIGGDIELAYQHALEKHLTLANMAAHVAGELANLDANPLVAIVLQTGLGPQGTAALADIIRSVAGGLARLDQQAAAIPLPDAQPAEPAPDPAPVA